MTLSINLKDSVFTTQSSTVYVDLKSKTKILTRSERIYDKNNKKKRMCFVLLVGRSAIVELVF